MGEIRGLILLSRFEYLEHTLGEQAMKQLKELLSPDARKIVEEQIFPVNLYPFSLLEEIDQAIQKMLDSPPEQLFREMGQQFGNVLADRYFYNYLEARDPAGFLQQFGRLYFHLVFFGTYQATARSGHQTEVQIRYPQGIHKPYCWFVQSVLSRGLHHCGAREIQLKEPHCSAEQADACVYQFQWQMQ